MTSFVRITLFMTGVVLQDSVSFELVSLLCCIMRGLRVSCFTLHSKADLRKKFSLDLRKIYNSYLKLIFIFVSK